MDRSSTPTTLNPQAREFRPPDSEPQGPPTLTEEVIAPALHSHHQTRPQSSVAASQIATHVSQTTSNAPNYAGIAAPPHQLMHPQIMPSDSRHIAPPGSLGATGNPLPGNYPRRAMTGWPKGHPFLLSSQYNGIHPSKVPDMYFLCERSNPYLIIRDPYGTGPFDASSTPVSFTRSLSHSLARILHRN